MNPASDNRGKRIRIVTLIALFVVVATACTSAPSDSGPAGPTPVLVSPPTALPAAKITFRVTPPDGTSDEADISLVMLDEVTGFTFNSVTFPMDRARDGTWSLETTLPAGMLLRYRYQLVSPQSKMERTASGEPVRARALHIPESGLVAKVHASL